MHHGTLLVTQVIGAGKSAFGIQARLEVMVLREHVTTTEEWTAGLGNKTITAS